MKAAVLITRLVGFAVLALLWVQLIPYHQVSAFIGAHFPWPANRSWKWGALLLEGAMIQLVVTIPIAIAISVAYRNWAIAVASALAAIFFLASWRTSQVTPYLPYDRLFVWYLAICHSIFFVGTTLLMRSNIRWSGP
jgi:hypothetical protein